MKLSLLFLLGVCYCSSIAPAYAQEVVYNETVGLAHFATITHNNSLTSSPDFIEGYTFETQYGPVVLQLKMTRNVDCTPACPDTLTVVDLPDNVIAIPLEVITPERSSLDIKLYYYQGT